MKNVLKLSLLTGLLLPIFTYTARETIHPDAQFLIEQANPYIQKTARIQAQIRAEDYRINGNAYYQRDDESPLIKALEKRQQRISDKLWNHFDKKSPQEIGYKSVKSELENYRMTIGDVYRDPNRLSERTASATKKAQESILRIFQEAEELRRLDQEDSE